MIFDSLKNLQKELSIFLLSIVIAVIVLIVSQGLWQASNQSKQTAIQQLEDAKLKYYTSLNQKLLLEKFEQQYLQLKQAGITSKEKRLNWINALENISTQFNIPYLKYRIEKRSKVKMPLLQKKYPGIDLYHSKMTLNMQLLHEGDLYTIINNLRQKSQGLFTVQQCDIKRNLNIQPKLINSKTDKNFSASCLLTWYTMQKKSFALPKRRNR